MNLEQSKGFRTTVSIRDLELKNSKGEWFLGRGNMSTKISTMNT